MSFLGRYLLGFLLGQPAFEMPDLEFRGSDVREIDHCGRAHAHRDGDRFAQFFLGYRARIVFKGPTELRRSKNRRVCWSRPISAQVNGVPKQRFRSNDSGISG